MKQSEEKKNCWEVMKCGREPGGNNAEKLGVCPAAIEARADGIHSGHNGGRCCWVIAGTSCQGQQGTFAQRFRACSECPFYKKVTMEENRYLTFYEINEIINKTGG